MTTQSDIETVGESLAVVNARVWTADSRRPWADALLTSGDQIAAVGSSAEVMKRTRPSTRVIDARGMLVVPGFIDAHIHFLQGGLGLSSVQLRDAATPSEFTRRIADVREDASGGYVDQKRRLGSRALGRGAPDARLDRPRHGESSCVGESARRPHVAGEQRGATRGRNHSRHAGRRRRNDRSRRERRTDGCFQGQRANRWCRARRRRCQVRSSTTRSVRRCDSSRATGVTSVHHMGTWDDLDVFERAREGRATRDADLRRGAHRHAGSGCAIASRRRGAVTTGCASARSRASSTGRSVRTRRRCSSHSTMRRRSRVCS